MTQQDSTAPIDREDLTSSTLKIIRYAEAGLKAIFKFGYNYQRAGIMLTGLVPADHRQGVFTRGQMSRSSDSRL